MLHHIVVFTWNPGTTAEQVADLERALADLQAQVPELRRYAYGPNLGLTAGSADFGIAAEFDDEAGWRAYDQHPAHAKVRSDVLAPMIASRAVVQFRS